MKDKPNLLIIAFELWCQDESSILIPYYAGRLWQIMQSNC